MLVEAGVKRIYAITGDSLNPVNDAVRRDGRLQWIHVRHEEAGAYAASMEAELNGIGCCMGSSGPSLCRYVTDHRLRYLWCVGLVALLDFFDMLCAVAKKNINVPPNALA